MGFAGVEEEYDYYLRQEEGGLSVEVDHRGRLVRALGFRPPQNGKDIELTLNLKIQKIVEDKLDGKVGCVIIMDPNTGEIIAMASYPNFNPVVFVKRSNSAIRSLFQDSQAPLLNRAIASSYPAGSVFKLIVAAAALEIGKINLSKTFFCAGKARIGRQEFACWDTHGAQNLAAAITHSCNVFFYNTGLLVGAQLIHDYALRFGFARVTGIDLPSEASGFVPSPLWRKVAKLKNWFDGDTANLSIGQGDVLVTPIQIARMMAVFANKGYLVTPYIVKSIQGKDISRHRRKIANIALKESTLNNIRADLRSVVADPSGTANNLATLSVAVAGKTGTAQAPPGEPHGWFVGFFPFKDPKFVICVFLERGGAGYYASSLAKLIIESMILEGLV
jgi:penicillin-binding protein 2